MTKEKKAEPTMEEKLRAEIQELQDQIKRLTKSNGEGASVEKLSERVQLLEKKIVEFEKAKTITVPDPKPRPAPKKKTPPKEPKAQPEPEPTPEPVSQEEDEEEGLLS